MSVYIHNRLIGRDVTLYQIDGTDVIDRYQDASLDVRVERVDVTVVKDGSRRSRVAHYNWRSACGAIVESSMLLLSKAVANQLADMAWAMTTGDNTANRGHAFTGIVGSEGFSTRFGESAQNEGGEFTGTSDLYMSDTAGANVTPLAIYPDTGYADLNAEIAAHYTTI